MSETTLPRTILIAVTACEGGVVVVTPSKGDPRAIVGDAAKELHALACDARLPVHTVEPGSNTVDRLATLAERLFNGGGA
jgi:hypothetical protein